MGSSSVKHVVNWDSSEASSTKYPGTFEKFRYRSQAIDDINSIKNDLLKKIGDDIDQIKTSYGNLIELHTEFTGFQDAMTKNITSLDKAYMSIKNAIDLCLTDAKNAVEDHIATDDSFKADLDLLNQLLSKGSLSEGNTGDWGH